MDNLADGFSRFFPENTKLGHRELRQQCIVVESDSFTEFNREITQEKQGLQVTNG